MKWKKYSTSLKSSQINKAWNDVEVKSINTFEFKILYEVILLKSWIYSLDKKLQEAELFYGHIYIRYATSGTSNTSGNKKICFISKHLR